MLLYVGALNMWARRHPSNEKYFTQTPLGEDCLAQVMSPSARQTKHLCLTQSQLQELKTSSWSFCPGSHHICQPFPDSSSRYHTCTIPAVPSLLQVKQKGPLTYSEMFCSNLSVWCFVFLQAVTALLSRWHALLFNCSAVSYTLF